MVAVEIRNYNKMIKKNHVLNIPQLTLQGNKVYGFLGRNGSGKTMLFRAICGLIQPDSGTVKVFGKTIGKEVSFPDNLGVLIEHIGFWPHVSGVENLRFLAGIRKKIDDKAIFEALGRIGLSLSEANKKYATYSLGMKQKLAIAQAIMESPQLLVLDEPSNSLDEKAVDDLWKIISQEKARGATVLISSHHQDELALCDQLYKMIDGCIQEIEQKESK